MYTDVYIICSRSTGNYIYLTKLCIFCICSRSTIFTCLEYVYVYICSRSTIFTCIEYVYVYICSRSTIFTCLEYAYVYTCSRSTIFTCLDWVDPELLSPTRIPTRDLLARWIWTPSHHAMQTQVCQNTGDNPGEYKHRR